MLDFVLLFALGCAALIGLFLIIVNACQTTKKEKDAKPVYQTHSEKHKAKSSNRSVCVPASSVKSNNDTIDNSVLQTMLVTSMLDTPTHTPSCDDTPSHDYSHSYDHSPSYDGGGSSYDCGSSCDSGGCDSGGCGGCD